jgi:predicted ATPase
VALSQSCYPLFVEEMTKAVMEAESEGEAQRTAAAVPSPALSVPPSLHASLMARLDRLGSAKEVAQIGATIGREFSHSLLAAVVRKPEADLGAALDRLIQSGLLFRQGVPPHATYLFKDALVQDAAYGTLLREPRRALHAHIAETLESQFADIVESQPELLARHCTEAGQIEKAAGLRGKAGQRSAWRSIGAAMTAVETTKEKWCEAEIHRLAGEIALMSPERDAAKAEAYFDRALAVARQQQAKSWELRTAMSLARLWRDQGKVRQARELLAPVYGWFTEGFDTCDLKEAKALLDELAS